MGSKHRKRQQSAEEHVEKLRIVTPETAQGRNEIVMTPLGHDVLGMFDDKGVFWKAPPPLNEASENTKGE